MSNSKAAVILVLALGAFITSLGVVLSVHSQAEGYTSPNTVILEEERGE